MISATSRKQDGLDGSDRAGTRPLVLVTDDHADTRVLFSTLLATRGYAVVEAVDGEQAVNLAESLSPDLILMDSNLPVLDGVNATKRIREQSKRRIPIVFICGRAEPNFRLQALAAGCDEFLLKPLDFEELGAVLEKHLGNNQNHIS